MEQDEKKIETENHRHVIDRKTWVAFARMIVWMILSFKGF